MGEYLKVSAQAVSKWETGGGYPDVALIVQIADLFGVTTDTLLCHENQDNDKEIVTVCDEADRLICKKMFTYAVELMKTARENYPTDERVAYKLARALYWVAQTSADEKSYEEAIELYTEVCENSQNDQMRENAARELMYCYNAIGRIDEALKYSKISKLN